MFRCCFFQVLDPWIQERSLEYFKYQNLLTEFLSHAEKCGKAKLINENGEPNITLIKRYKLTCFSHFYLYAQLDRGPGIAAIFEYHEWDADYLLKLIKTEAST